MALPVDPVRCNVEVMIAVGLCFAIAGSDDAKAAHCPLPGQCRPSGASPGWDFHIHFASVGNPTPRSAAICRRDCPPVQAMAKDAALPDVYAPPAIAPQTKQGIINRRSELKTG